MVLKQPREGFCLKAFELTRYLALNLLIFPCIKNFLRETKSNILTFDYLNVHIISEQSTNKKQESSS